MFAKQYIVGLGLLALVAVAASQGARLVGHKQHPTLADHCYDDQHDLTVKVNETVRPTGVDWQCIEVFCRDDYVLQINSCQRGMRACNKKPDFSKPYPECCDAVC